MTVGLLVGALAMITPDVGAATVVTISGVVRNALGQPVAGARVSDQRQEVLSEADGSYALKEDRPARGWQVSVNKPGYAPQLRTVSLTEVQETVDFELLYLMNASVVPRVLGPQAGPLDVTATSKAPANACVRWLDVETATSLDLLLDAGATANTWRASHAVSPGRADGGHPFNVTATDCQTAKPVSITATGSFYTDETGPKIDSLQPSGWTNSPSPTLGARVLDAIAGVASVTLRLDGSDLAWTYEPSTGAVRAATSGLSVGSHTFSVSAVDHVGNVSSIAGSFSVDTASPTASNASPVGTIASASPLLSVRMLDDLSGVQPASLAMTLRRDGVSNRLQSRWDAASGELSYQVPATITGVGLGESPLLDGRYEVVASGVDQAGNLVTAGWSFTVRHWVPSLPMSDSALAR